MVSLENLPEPIGGPGSWQWQVFSLKSTDFSHSHGPAKTGDCTHLPDLPSQLAISLYICIILCKGYSAFLIRVFHSSCKSALQCMRFFASEAKCKLSNPLSCGHGKGVQISLYDLIPWAFSKMQLLDLGFASTSYCILPAAHRSVL